MSQYELETTAAVDAKCAKMLGYESRLDLVLHFSLVVLKEWRELHS